MKRHILFATTGLTLFALTMGSALSQATDAKRYHLERCELLPLPHSEVSFRIDGVEKTSWHFAPDSPRPFFYPFNGPSGVSLTRMGHPGAANHDHHRSIWFAHHDVGGVDFWSDNTRARIRQKTWLCYLDGDDETVMATLSGWYDEENREVLEQEIVAALRPGAGGGHELEIQITMRPPGSTQSVELGKTNFGFLAVRVAKSISRHFGGGELTDSEGRAGEEAIFGNTAKWVDYSGPVAAGSGADRNTVIEGITCFDHPSNPRYPTRWHVRSDGWMGASFCFEKGHTIEKGRPLTLRYLLSAHGGPCDPERAGTTATAFAARPGFKVGKSKRPHHQYEVSRIGIPPADK